MKNRAAQKVVLKTNIAEYSKPSVIPDTHRILIRADTIPEKTSGGIILTRETVDREEAAAKTGTLCAAGPEAWKDGKPHAIKTRVLYGAYVGSPVIDPVTGVRFVIMNDEDVLGEITNEGEQ